MNEKVKNNDEREMILDFLGIKNFETAIDIICKYIHEHFERACALLPLTACVVLWYLRAVRYCFQSGRFHTYNISSIYIEINDNFLFQLICGVATVFWVGLSNYIYLAIHIKIKNKICRAVTKIIFFITEGTIILFLSTFLTNSNFIDSVRDIARSSNEVIFLFLLMVFILSVSINMFAIEAILYLKAQKNKKNKKNKKSSSENNEKIEENTEEQLKKSSNISLIMKNLLLIGIIGTIVLGVSYFYGSVFESAQKSYKIIAEEVNSDRTDGSEYKYIISDTEKMLYAVVFENKDIYIVCPMNHVNDGSKMDKTQTKIMDKNNISTVWCDNIYELQ